LEARFFPLIAGQLECIDYYQFNRILRRYTFEKKNGGFGLRNELVTQLNVTSERSPNIRESIRGNDSVKLYWVSENIEMVKKHSEKSVFQMTKEKKDYVNLLNYPVRVCLSEEKMNNKAFKLLNDVEFPKEYRLQNRISVYTEDNLFRFDFTSVKFGRGKTFRRSKVVNAFPCHEIEIEYIGESQNKDDIFNNFMNHISTFLSIYYDTSNLLTQTLKKDILDNYKLLISKSEKLKKSNRKNNKNKTQNAYTARDFITAKPVTLHRDNIRKTSGIVNILRNYGVTYKADGLNVLLYVAPQDGDNLFLIDSNFNVISLGKSLPEWKDSLLECEFIRDKNLLCVYDMLFAKGLDIRNKPLESFNDKQSSRLQYLEEFIDSVENKKDTIQIIEKQHVFGNDEEMFVKINKLWSDKEGQPFHVDGLIFTPATEPYPNKPGSWPMLLKWKPPSLNSIDFLIETIKNESGKDILFPSEVPGASQFKKLKLYTTGSFDKFNRKTGRLNRKPFPKLFKEVSVPVNAEGQIIARDPLSGLVIEIADDTIVEFSYDETKDYPWIPIRVRHEKTTRYRRNNDYFGNGSSVAENIWKSIINPVSVKMITTGEIPALSQNKQDVKYVSTEKSNRLPYQNFHTAFIKKTLLEMVALDPPDSDRGKGYLIDFGVCRGGDLNRWKSIGFKKIVGIDVDPECVQEATNRYKRSNNEFKATFLCGDLSKLIFPKQESACELTSDTNWKELMKLTLPQKYMFDVVSSQFVIHYFFLNELSLRTYLQNVTDNLKIGGSFVGTTFDGKRVYDFLKRKKEAVGTINKETIWKITKLYEKRIFTNGRPNFGMAIDVFVKTIGIPHKEYLVSFKYLEKIASEYGLELKEIIPFSELWKKGKDENTRVIADINAMTDSEKTFSFLSSAFIFKKVKNAPDSTYKKIIKLQKKNT
jgi:hypothetical protein